MTAERTFIALGTNLPFGAWSGPVLLQQALDRIEAAGVKVLRRSSFWESAPQPAELAHQPPFINAVAEVDPGAQDPTALFAVLAAIESEFGRSRRTRWAARTLDLDIVDFKGQAGRIGSLELPHPRMQERAFVLAPLAEIAPDWRHPATGAAISVLLATAAEQPIKRLA